MTTDRRRNEDTRELATLKTLLMFAAVPTPDTNWRHTMTGIQSQADLNAAKAAASRLTTDGMREMTEWLERQIGRRDGF